MAARDEDAGAGADDNIFSCQIGNVQILCSFDRNIFKAQITCIANDVTLPQSKKKILFQWTELMLKHFEEIHGLSRVLLLLPDKCATAIAINNEDLPPPDSGDFLLQLVKDLWLFYSSDRIIRKESKGFVETIQELIQNIDQLMILLNSRESAELILETTELLVNKCDKIYLVVLFYLDFVHAELLSIQRGTSTEVSRQELFDKAKNSILKKYEHNLSDEFAKLSR